LGPAYRDYWERYLKSIILIWHTNIKVVTFANSSIACWVLVLQTLPSKPYNVTTTHVLSGTIKIGLECWDEQLLASETFLALQFSFLKLSISVYTSEV